MNARAQRDGPAVHALHLARAASQDARQPLVRQPTSPRSPARCCASRAWRRSSAKREAVLPFPIKGGKLYLYNNNPLLRMGYRGHDRDQDRLHATPPGRAWSPPRGAAAVKLGVVLLDSRDTGGQATQLLDRGLRGAASAPLTRVGSVRDGRARAQVYRRRRLVALAALLGLVVVVVAAHRRAVGAAASPASQAARATAAPSRRRPRRRSCRAAAARSCRDYRVVAYYGAPQDAQLGALGIGTPGAAPSRGWSARRSGYARRRRPVLPALELIAVVAAARSGRGRPLQPAPAGLGDPPLPAGRRAAPRRCCCSTSSPAARTSSPRRRACASGSSSPTWGSRSTPSGGSGRGQVPGQVIGHVGSREVNATTAWLVAARRALQPAAEAPARPRVHRRHGRRGAAQAPARAWPTCSTSTASARSALKIAKYKRFTARRTGFRTASSSSTRRTRHDDARARSCACSRGRTWSSTSRAWTSGPTTAAASRCRPATGSRSTSTRCCASAWSRGIAAPVRSTSPSRSPGSALAAVHEAHAARPDPAGELSVREQRGLGPAVVGGARRARPPRGGGHRVRGAPTRCATGSA